MRCGRIELADRESGKTVTFEIYEKYIAIQGKFVSTNNNNSLLFEKKIRKRW